MSKYNSLRGNLRKTGSLEIIGKRDCTQVLVTHNNAIQGSVQSARNMLRNSAFQVALRAMKTRVPSTLYIFFGSAMSSGKLAPKRVKTRNPIYHSRWNQCVIGMLYSRRT